jgi:hypothetical protein
MLCCATRRYADRVGRRALASCVLALCACASSHPPAQAPPPTAASAPLFSTDPNDHWLDRPPVERPRTARPQLTDADRSEFADVAVACAKIGAPNNHGNFRQQLNGALQGCPRGGRERFERCSLVCSDALQTALRSRRSPGPFAGTAPTAQVSPPPPPAPVPDTFERALRDCIERVRDSGGDAPAVCRFDRPLDEMDFGQRHCDARCAEESRSPAEKSK